jgi:hypothetical protein
MAGAYAGPRSRPRWSKTVNFCQVRDTIWRSLQGEHAFIRLNAYRNDTKTTQSAPILLSHEIVMVGQALA